MQSTAPQEPRATFKYQKRYLYLELVMSLVTIMVTIVSWTPSVFTKFAYNMIIPSAVRAAIFLTVTAVVFSAFILFLIKQLRKIEIVITDERVIIKSPYKLRIILFSEITSIKYVRIPLLQGFLKIKSPEHSMTIPLYVENITGMVQAIATGLVRYGKPDIFDKKVIDELNNSAKIYNYAQKRAQYAFIPIIYASAALFFFNLMISIHFWDIGLIALMFWSCTGIIVPSFIYIFSDIILNHKMRTMIALQKDSKPPQTIYLQVSLVVMLIYFMIGWFFKSLVS